MGWVTRGSKSYFYRSKRIGGKVQTEAFSGLRAEIEAERDEEARYEHRREADQFAEEDEIDAELERLFGKIEDFTAERLEAAGYHRHKREWRRRRNAKG
jgi:hypothetical protein